MVIDEPTILQEASDRLGEIRSRARQGRALRSFQAWEFIAADIFDLQSWGFFHCINMLDTQDS